MKAWCLFEQSGTFKNAFKEFGFEAYDCDILDDFKQTDFKVDLFDEIVKEYAKIELWQIKNSEREAIKHEKITYQHFLDIQKDLKNTLFSKISSDDLVFAFFPCVKFTEKAFLNARCENSGMKNYTDLERLCYSRASINAVEYFYEVLTKLCEIAILKGFKLIIENPNSQPHFLNLYFPFKPDICIADRSKYGDYFKKPTNFWFFNFKPANNLLLMSEGQKGRRLNMSGGVGCERNRDKNELVRWFKEKHGIETTLQKARSLISPTFARNFIKSFILSADELAKIS